MFVDLFAIKYKQQQIFYDHFHDHENAVPDEKYMFLKYYRFKNQNNFKNYFIPLLLNDNSRKKVFDALQIWNKIMFVYVSISQSAFCSFV